MRKSECIICVVVGMYAVNQMGFPLTVDDVQRDHRRGAVGRTARVIARVYLFGRVHH